MLIKKNSDQITKKLFKPKMQNSPTYFCISIGNASFNKSPKILCLTCYIPVVHATLCVTHELLTSLP